MKIEIAKCEPSYASDGCPFNYDGITCVLDREVDTTNSDKPPAECPLRREGVAVTLPTAAKYPMVGGHEINFSELSTYCGDLVMQLRDAVNDLSTIHSKTIVWLRGTDTDVLKAIHAITDKYMAGDGE